MDVVNVGTTFGITYANVGPWVFLVILKDRTRIRFEFFYFISLKLSSFSY